MDIESGSFIWDSRKEIENIEKHGIDFTLASKVFFDVTRKIYKDLKHSRGEERLFCVGKVADRIITVRFTYRGHKIRIIGAGYWRAGKRYYDKEKNDR